jgi:hypothetical protein
LAGLFCAAARPTGRISNVTKGISPMSQTEAAPQLSGTMFLYQKPELLNSQTHGGLGLQVIERPFDFCSRARAIPLTISEIPEAAKYYPVVFASMEETVPLAVVGLVDDVNLYVDDQGNWEPYAYVPGYIRRYPFGLAGEVGSDRFALVIDTGYPGVSPYGDRKLFEGGQMSEIGRQALEFTKTYEADRRLTETVMATLKKFNLIQGQAAQYTPQGSTEQRTFAQYFGVEEPRLTALSDADFLELRRMNVLHIIYAHLMSLANWRNLIARRMRRYNMSELEATTGQRLS